MYFYNLPKLKVMFFKRSAAFLRPHIGNLANYGTKKSLNETEIPIPKEVAPDSARKPFKVTLEEGKKYSWCACGHAKTALCDGRHKDQTLNIKERPIKFTVEKTKDYWLCTCQQTKNIPFCDGSHKKIGVKDEPSSTEK